MQRTFFFTYFYRKMLVKGHKMSSCVKLHQSFSLSWTANVSGIKYSCKNGFNKYVCKITHLKINHKRRRKRNVLSNVTEKKMYKRIVRNAKQGDHPSTVSTRLSLQGHKRSWYKRQGTPWTGHQNTKY